MKEILEFGSRVYRVLVAVTSSSDWHTLKPENGEAKYC
jgi:hypothetical protein